MVAVLGAGIGGKAASISSAMAISGTLIDLVLALGSVSGGHFNPVITVLQWRARQRGFGCTTWYVAAQILGGIAGALLVDAMFAVSRGTPTAELPNAAAVVSEALATLGLVMVVFCSIRSSSKLTGPFAVGLWPLGAIIATPTGSIANPRRRHQHARVSVERFVKRGDPLRGGSDRWRHSGGGMRRFPLSIRRTLIARGQILQGEDNVDDEIIGLNSCPIRHIGRRGERADR
ncbi:membrane hypothetical protein [Rhizobium mesoamericanum STM3625]|uniref:Uncharacterized protein n=2 Tax=Rhizobium mesoamericanum TaxID=1079800 RepID=K0Q3H8_9HYPH|nr:membrane hypothetical protein [Rhizobium mesoamericanum STM3625]